MANEKLLFKDLSCKIVGLAMQVHKELGHGFFENNSENNRGQIFIIDN